MVALYPSEDIATIHTYQSIYNLTRYLTGAAAPEASVLYGSHTDTIWQAYGYTICLPYCVNMAGIWWYHIASILTPYDSHVV